MRKAIEATSDTLTVLSWASVFVMGAMITVLGGAAAGAYGFSGAAEAALDFAGMEEPGAIKVAGEVGSLVGAASIVLMLAGSQGIRRNVKEAMRAL